MHQDAATALALGDFLFHSLDFQAKSSITLSTMKTETAGVIAFTNLNKHGHTPAFGAKILGLFPGISIPACRGLVTWQTFAFPCHNANHSFVRILHFYPLHA